jgi:hypothetical protein
MKLKNKIFYYFLLFSAISCYSQNKESLIRFGKNRLKNQKFKFKINGKILNPNKENNKIIINKADFDTLVCFKNEKLMSVSILRFKENTEYIITINPCNIYNIRPLNNPKKGVVRYHYISGKNDSVFADLDFYSQKISPKLQTDYYDFIPSAMCRFGKKKILIRKLKSEKEIEPIYFHFLHGEKLTFIYDEQRNKKTLTLDGYLREKENYPVMEMIN